MDWDILEKEAIDFETGDVSIFADYCWWLREIPWRACLLFGDKEMAFKNSLDLYLQTLITEFFWFTELQFKIERKIHIKAVVDVSRGSGIRVFLWRTWRRSWQETTVSSKTVRQDLNLKFRSIFNRAFSNHGCFHCAVLKALDDFKRKRAHKEIDW